MKNLVIHPSRYAFANSIDNLFNHFFDMPAGFAGEYDFHPAVDVRENKEGIKLTIELPGMNKEDIKVWVENGVLTVSGERNHRSASEEGEYIRTEISSGKFSRSFRLPKTVDWENVSADYRNGLLIVKLNKVEEAKPKEIEIKVS